MKVVITHAAAADLESIGDRIAARSPARAISYIDELRRRCAQIAELPHAGPPRSQWGEGIRIVIHGPYLIVYRIVGDIVQVLRIVHGARDLNQLFESDPPTGK